MVVKYSWWRYDIGLEEWLHWQTFIHHSEDFWRWLFFYNNCTSQRKWSKAGEIRSNDIRISPAIKMSIEESERTTETAKKKGGIQSPPTKNPYMRLGFWLHHQQQAWGPPSLFIYYAVGNEGDLPNHPSLSTKPIAIRIVTCWSVSWHSLEKSVTFLPSFPQPRGRLPIPPN